MAKKTVKANDQGIEKIPADKPIVYKLLDEQNKNVYTGTAKKGNVQQRLKDHLPGGKDPIPDAKKIQIEQMPTIEDAKKKEANIVSRTKPKHNKQGK